MSGIEGLEKRLRELASIIMRDFTDDTQAEKDYQKCADESEQNTFRIDWRNQKLTSYRDDAMRISPSPEKYASGKLTARLFSYIHNEFNFNAPRPISRTARISHLVFAPLYTEKTNESLRTLTSKLFPADPYKFVSETTSSLLKFLWERSYHRPEQEDFRGGKDAIFEFVNELFDFTEPYITPKRRILETKEVLLSVAPKEAIDLTREFERRIEAAGLSNRLTNTVEYFLEGPPHVKHFRWTRHARPYQTFTFTSESGGQTILENAKAPFAKPALEDFPSRIFENILGRYVQGANYVIVPVEYFFDKPVFPDATKRSEAVDQILLDLGIVADRERPLLFATVFAALVRRNSNSTDFVSVHEFEARLINLAKDRASWDRPNSDEGVASLFDLIHSNKTYAPLLDKFVIAVSELYVRDCFGADEGVVPKSGRSTKPHAARQKAEYVGSKCMDGRAYVFSNLGNNHTVDDIGPIERGQQQISDIFTRTVCIDCGMNRFQRGRLIQNLTEFATERTMSLLWIARFRLLHNALNVIEARISLAVANYHDGKAQLTERKNIGLHKIKEESVVPFEYWRWNSGLTQAEIHGEEVRAARERTFIIALEFLSSCLTVLNNFIEGGIVDRASSSVASIDTLSGKLRSIREVPIAGHQSFADFIVRRFVPATRVIGRTAERYRRLRDRISEISDLINAKLSANEWHEHQKQAKRQVKLLQVAEYFGEAALGYYGANLLVELGNAGCNASKLAKLCEKTSAGTWQLHSFFEFTLYLVATLGVGYLVVRSLMKFRSERNNDEAGQEIADAKANNLDRQVSK